MSSRKRARAAPSAPDDSATPPTAVQQPRTDRVTLDVGGTTFVTSASTLTAASAYFQRMLSERWTVEHAEFFLDRDPESFAVLLSYMRSGLIDLPDGDVALARRVLVDAEFLGLDSFLTTVKAITHRHLHELGSSDDVAAAAAFDEEHGGLMPALTSKVLPARYFGPAPAPKPDKCIKGFVPAAEPLDVLFRAAGEDADEWLLPVVGHATVEYADGKTKVEPMVAQPKDDAHDEDQCVLASEWAQSIHGDDSDETAVWSIRRRPVLHALPKGAIVANVKRDDGQFGHIPVLFYKTDQNGTDDGTHYQQFEQVEGQFLGLDPDKPSRRLLKNVCGMKGVTHVTAVNIPNKAEMAVWNMMGIKCQHVDEAQKVATQVVMEHSH